MRTFAWEYGKTLQPSHGELRSLYGTLQLGTCSVPVPMVDDIWMPAHQLRTPAGAIELTVCAKTGDDTAAAAALFAGAATAREPASRAQIDQRPPQSQGARWQTGALASDSLF